MFMVWYEAVRKEAGVKTRMILVGMVAVITCLSWLFAPPQSAQASESQEAVETGPVPRLSNGKPDLSGVWQVPYVPDMTVTQGDQRGTAELPFTRWGLENWESYDPADGDDTGSCMPFGRPRAREKTMFGRRWSRRRRRVRRAAPPP